MADTPPTAPATKRRAAIAGAAVLLATTALTVQSEGFAAKPYWDPAHIRTYCFGETEHVQERAHSKSECEILLEHRMAADYAPPLERCLPQLVDERRVKVFAAFLDAAYNAGPGAVCSSRMAASIRADRWGAACAGFYGWRATATDRRTGRRVQLKGLELRREREAMLCFQGVEA